MLVILVISWVILADLYFRLDVVISHISAVTLQLGSTWRLVISIQLAPSKSDGDFSLKPPRWISFCNICACSLCSVELVSSPGDALPGLWTITRADYLPLNIQWNNTLEQVPALFFLKYSLPLLFPTWKECLISSSLCSFEISLKVIVVEIVGCAILTWRFARFGFG